MGLLLRIKSPFPTVLPDVLSPMLFSRTILLPLLIIISVVYHAHGAQANPLQVVASFSIIGDMVQAIGKDRVQVTTLVGPESDVHIYEPKPVDVVAITKADVIMINGLEFEGFLPRLITASQVEAPIIKLSNGIDVLTDTNQQPDPHAWQSAHNGKTYITNIATALCQADPDNCHFYETNAHTYREQLTQLDQEIQATIDALPEDRRTVITQHRAFQYFDARYGLHFHALEGSTAHAEASARAVADAIKALQQGKATALLAESFQDPRLITQISHDAGVPVSGTLFADTLSGPTGDAPTYLALLTHNIQQLKQALMPDTSTRE